MWWDTWWERHRGPGGGAGRGRKPGSEFYGADRTTDHQHFRKLSSRKKKYCTNCVREKKKLFGASRPSTLFPSARIPFRPNSEPSTVALNPIFGPAQTHIPTVGEPELQREKIRTPAAAPLSLSLSLSLSPIQWRLLETSRRSTWREKPRHQGAPRGRPPRRRDTTTRALAAAAATCGRRSWPAAEAEARPASAWCTGGGGRRRRRRGRGAPSMCESPRSDRSISRGFGSRVLDFLSISPFR